MSGAKDVAHQIQAFIGDRVSHQHLLLEILGREIRLADKWMAMRKQCQNLIAKEGMVDHPGTLSGMGNNDQIGAVFPKKPDRIGVKPGDQIELYLRPALAEGVHRWHQPVETRVTFHRDAKDTGLALGNTCYVPLSIPNATADVISKIHQVSTGQPRTVADRSFVQRAEWHIPLQLLAHGAKQPVAKDSAASRLWINSPSRPKRSGFSDDAIQAWPL